MQATTHCIASLQFALGGGCAAQCFTMFTPSSYLPAPLLNRTVVWTLTLPIWLQPPSAKAHWLLVEPPPSRGVFSCKHSSSKSFATRSLPQHGRRGGQPRAPSMRPAAVQSLGGAAGNSMALCSQGGCHCCSSCRCVVALAALAHQLLPSQLPPDSKPSAAVCVSSTAPCTCVPSCCKVAPWLVSSINNIVSRCNKLWHCVRSCFPWSPCIKRACKLFVEGGMISARCHTPDASMNSPAMTSRMNHL